MDSIGEWKPALNQKASAATADTQGVINKVRIYLVSVSVSFMPVKVFY